MKGSNIKFHYMHRDSGNYKIFGEIVFSNEEGLSPGEAEMILRKKLIDTEYFFPSENEIPLFPEHSDSLYFTEWYEFLKFSNSNEESNYPRDISIFLSQF